MLHSLFLTNYNMPYELQFSPLLQILVCFGIAVVKELYVGYAVIALLVEINSIFLHLRQLLRFLSFQKDHPVYRLNSLLNLGKAGPKLYAALADGDLNDPLLCWSLGKRIHVFIAFGVKCHDYSLPHGIHAPITSVLCHCHNCVLQRAFMWYYGPAGYPYFIITICS